MFKALLISLGDGQSYKNIEICEDVDFDRLKIPKLLGDLTCCFYADKKCTLLHNWAINLVHLNNDFIKTGMYAERLILDGNVSFSEVIIIDNSNLNKYGIPDFFGVNDRGQCTFSCNQGTFITSSTNVVSIMVENNRHVGITKKINFKKGKTKVRKVSKITRIYKSK